MRVMEIVSYDLNSGTENEFIDASHEIGIWATQQEGFVQRHLTRSETGRWTEIILWENKQCAEDASKKIMGELGACRAMTMINPQSIKMIHADVKAASI